MCGFLFVNQADHVGLSYSQFEKTLKDQSWRGPDATKIIILQNGKAFLGHNRLSILDPISRSDQPMKCSRGRFLIAFNGEIYNHLEIRKKLKVSFKTNSDTETIVEAYSAFGLEIFSWLDGMFSIFIMDLVTSDWVIARDRFGIKPLYIFKNSSLQIVGSEPAGIADLSNSSPCELSIEEWKIVRRPIPGKSFFKNVEEVLPGEVIQSNGNRYKFAVIEPSKSVFYQEEFEEIIRKNVHDHELSDVKHVSLLSGGIDSAVITALSAVTKTYCVGLKNNNEFVGAEDSATRLHKQLIKIETNPSDLIEVWKSLILKRGEPLGVPNEGLIYIACKQMNADEKVVLTGEGADEILFGYDKIFRWASMNKWDSSYDFLMRYGYSTVAQPTQRLIDYIESKLHDQCLLDFLEDFFFEFHLPGLLRRMDFASMAASKEARVPFVNK